MREPPTLRLPLVLRRRARSSPAEAVLLLGDGAAAAALAVLADRERGGAGAEAARIFRVAGGLLVVARDGGPPRPRPGAVRLRKLGPALFLPVDAEPSPALLDDEAEALTRRRGLVLLPGGRALAFDPSRPVPTGTLLAVDRRPAPAWEAPPEAPRRADRLVEVTRELPEDGAGPALDAGGDDLATEDPRPADAGAGRRLLGGAALGAGRGAMRLGRALGIERLADLGAGWVASALRIAPRLAEGLVGRQEAALRDLLREFREGDLERALRRALPMGKGGERGASVAGSADLPDRDPSYSLPEILGPAGGGPARYWFGGIDVQQELVREYHKAAREATRRGDYRRAAFIYGRLLEEYRLAANVLMQAGLARDAALIYLEKLDDRPAAARAFEAAGEFDRALGLYRQLGDFERVGDLLARLGEPERATAAYVAAADRIVAREGDYLKAGRLLRERAGRPDLAARRFADGWAARPWPNAVGCALELARGLADAGDAARLRALVDEADALLGPPGHEADASRFYNELAGLADRPALAAARDELRDRARVALAAKLRQRVEAGVAAPGDVGLLFGPARGWSAAVIRDAEYAVRAGAGAGAGRRRVEGPAPAAPAPTRGAGAQIAEGPVTATALARTARLAFVGTGRGAVLRLDPQTGETAPVGRYAMPVASIAVKGSGAMLAVLWHDRDSGRTVLASYLGRPDGSYEMAEGRAETARSAERPPFLVPAAAGVLDAIALWDGRRYLVLRWPTLTPFAEIPRRPDDDGGGPPASALLLPPAGPADPPTLLELGPAGSWGILATDLGAVDRRAIPWAPAPPPTAPAGSAPAVSWAFGDGGLLHLAGVGPDGALHHCRLDPSEGGAATTATRPAGDDPFRAACLIRPGLLAGIRGEAVDRFDVDGPRLRLRSTTPVPLDACLAAVPSPRTGELVLIDAGGRIGRVPMPM